MKTPRSSPLVKTSLALAALAFLAPGCAKQGVWSGVFSMDATGGAKTCVAPIASPAPVIAEPKSLGLTFSRSLASLCKPLIPARPHRDRLRSLGLHQRVAHVQGEHVRVVIGMDGGSTSSKAVLIDFDTGELLKKEYQLSKGNPISDTKEIMAQLRTWATSQGATMEVRGRMPLLAVVVEIEEAFLHCAKAFIRSRLWDPGTQIDRKELPTLARMIHDQLALQQPVEELDAYVEDGYRTTLY